MADAVIAVRRATGRFGLLVPMTALIDGRTAGRLWWGGQCVFPVDPGTHRAEATLGAFRAGPIDLRLRPGEWAEIDCQADAPRLCPWAAYPGALMVLLLAGRFVPALGGLLASGPLVAALVLAALLAGIGCLLDERRRRSVRPVLTLALRTSVGVTVDPG